MMRLLVLLLLLAVPSIAWSAPPGWSGAGEMSTPRRGHSVTPLATGEALIVGGDDGTTVSGSAQLYDWRTNAWSAARPLPEGRTGHAATRLADGRVLVIGSGTRPGLIYERASDTWSPAAPPRVDFGAITGATLLRSGKVLVLGIRTDNGTAVAELYDSATDTWSSAGTPVDLFMTFGFTTTLLPGGEVLVAGGECICINRLASRSAGVLAPFYNAAQIYNPTTNTWSSVAPMTAARSLHTATALRDGRVLVAGGVNSSGALATAEFYEPARRAWVPAAAMTSPRYGHSAALMVNGHVMAAGGTTLRSAETYDPATNAWVPVPGGMSAFRHSPTTTTLATGQLLVTGGFHDGRYLSSAEIYTPPTTAAIDPALEFTDRSTQTLAVRNTGEFPLLISDVTTTADDFAIAEDGCSRRAVTTTCVVRVRFTPSAPGERTASLVVSGNTDPEQSTVALTGTGPAPPTPTPTAEPPRVADADGDGVTDGGDNCPTTANADQADRDGDRIGDRCETLPSGDAPPVAGRTATARLISGEVLVKLPAGRRLAQATNFVPLKGVASIPIGSVVDARKGRVAIDAAGDFRTGGANRRLQAAILAAALFRLRQASTPSQAGTAIPPTDLVLQTPPGLERACAARNGVRPIKGIVRSLTANTIKGIFRAVGGASVTTVSGNATWIVQDRCNGTLTEVGRGTATVRDRTLGRTVKVRAGRGYLARAKLFSARMKRG